jgi:hypothetical protein
LIEPYFTTEVEMTTTLPVPATFDTHTGSPNQYHLRGGDARISYFPSGTGPLTADGPIMLIYRDSQRSATFRAQHADVVDVPNFGTCVTVTIETTPDAASMTATLLVPRVVLTAGRPARIRTAMIAAAHWLAAAGIGCAQRDIYRVITLTGEASNGPLPR